MRPDTDTRMGTSTPVDVYTIALRLLHLEGGVPTRVLIHHLNITLHLSGRADVFATANITWLGNLYGRSIP